MRGRWLIALFAIILGILCIRQLSYSWYSHKIECDAALLANNETEEKIILDSLAQDTLNLGIISYNYNDAKSKEMSLGLDLKGGINVILQVQVRDLLINLANNTQNPLFLEALKNTDVAQRSKGNQAYVDLFFEEFDKLKQSKNSNISYASPELFGNQNNADLIKFDATDEQVKEIVRDDVEKKVSTAYQVISSRIDQFGVVQPVVQRLGSVGDGRILVELPGVKDTDRVKKLLQSTAKLEFWKAERGNAQVINFFQSLNAANFIATADSTQSIPLSQIMQPSGSNSAFIVDLKDTATVNKVLQSPKLKDLMPTSIQDYKYYWANKPMELKDNKDANLLELYALSGDENGQPLLPGDVVSEASGERSANSIANEPIVNMVMKPEGAREWARITDQFKPSQANGNIGDGVAIVLDKLVYSAPNINGQITGGRSQISGNFTLQEAQDLANILQAGSLPASAKIVQAEIVGPSLGQEAINSSIISFLIAFALVLIWMIFYYSGAGIYSNLALGINILFIFGLLVGLLHATLTLPGIAGIILTIGMAIDANIIIYERVKEELAKGKNTKQAVADAYTWKGAISSIIDANVTTLLTAIILFIFGKGPVQGFATTLMIGIFTSVFTAIFITRYFIEKRLENGKNVAFFTGLTKNWFQKINVNFLSKRKIAYIISVIMILISLASLATRGLDLGIDFVGGRTYTVRFDKDVKADKIADDLAKVFINEDGQSVRPEVKIYGSANQVKISTKYKVNSESEEVDEEIRQSLFNGLKPYLPANMNPETFSEDASDVETKYGIMSSAKVGPTIADDIKRGSFLAVLGALIIVFIYIVIRFSKWQYSVGAVASVTHDTIIVLGIFSLLKGVVPFSLEIDQAFIAAILTVIGYSLNDTVIIFDRIREFVGDFPRMKFFDIINKAINTTFSRTINTSMSTLVVVACIFLFGGDSIRGFMFALLIGIFVGTYSSIFVASPLVYDLSKKKKED